VRFELPKWLCNVTTIAQWCAEMSMQSPYSNRIIFSGNTLALSWLEWRCGSGQHTHTHLDRTKNKQETLYSQIIHMIHWLFFGVLNYWTICIGYCTQAGLLAVLENWGMLPITTNGEAQGNYRCILKVSKQLRDLLECNNWLRLWVISFSFLYEKQIFDEVSTRDLIKIKRPKHITSTIV